MIGDKDFFRKTIRELRIEKGITQKKLSEELFISKTLISRLELGTVHPTVEVASLFATYFGVTTDYLLAGYILKARKVLGAKNDRP